MGMKEYRRQKHGNTCRFPEHAERHEKIEQHSGPGVENCSLRQAHQGLEEGSFGSLAEEGCRGLPSQPVRLHLGECPVDIDHAHWETHQPKPQSGKFFHVPDTSPPTVHRPTMVKWCENHQEGKYQDRVKMIVVICLIDEKNIEIESKKNCH